MLAAAPRADRRPEIARLMEMSDVKPTGRPRADRRRWYECAERRLRREITEAEAAAIYAISPRRVREWVAWCVAPSNDDPRADRCRRLASAR